jgi:(2R)-sulfolactate sulfo-lyase subunit alpha
MAEKPDFIVHDAEDDVGVVAVDRVSPGQTATGWVMATDATITVPVKEAVPLGHKLALRDFSAEDTITKYGQDIGRTIAAIPKGGYVHVHNAKTKRW